MRVNIIKVQILSFRLPGNILSVEHPSAIFRGPPTNQPPNIPTASTLNWEPHLLLGWLAAAVWRLMTGAIEQYTLNWQNQEQLHVAKVQKGYLALVGKLR